MSGWLSAVELQRRCKMDQLSKCEPAICFTSRRGTIAGFSVMRIMFLSTFSAQRNTPVSPYSEAIVILREGYGKNSANGARVETVDNGFSDCSESELA